VTASKTHVREEFSTIEKFVCLSRQVFCCVPTPSSITNHAYASATQFDFGTYRPRDHEVGENGGHTPTTSGTFRYVLSCEDGFQVEEYKSGVWITEMIFIIKLDIFLNNLASR